MFTDHDFFKKKGNSLRIYFTKYPESVAEKESTLRNPYIVAFSSKNNQLTRNGGVFLKEWADWFFADAWSQSFVAISGG